MLVRNIAYQKSGKGAEAIAARLHGLTPRLRSLLIIVDGKKSGHELLKLAANLGDGEAMLNELIAGGFIEPVAGSASTEAAEAPQKSSVPVPPGATSVQVDSATGSRNAQSLPDAKRLAVRLLVDLVGPTAESACIAIESAKTAEQFKIAVQRANSLVQSFRGEKAATRFLEQIEAKLQ